MDSEPTATPGTLYAVATPIGHLDDITLRALHVLQSVDRIAAEDTRHTQKLLRHHGVDSSLVSYHEHNEHKRTPELISQLQAGTSIALVTDAGTPSVSDPGYRLVRAAAAAGIRVVPIPGPSAVTTALSAAGLPTDSYVFIGFLPKKKARRRSVLESLASEPRTLIFYESPRRILVAIDELIEILGDREAVLAREMTKVYEEFLRDSLSSIRETLKQRETVRGECTLLVGGRTEDPGADIDAVRSALEDALEDPEARLSAVVKTVSEQFNMVRNRVYEMALEIRSGQNEADESSLPRDGESV